jgi:hypothetical protein
MQSRGFRAGPETANPIVMPEDCTGQRCIGRGALEVDGRQGTG